MQSMNELSSTGQPFRVLWEHSCDSVIEMLLQLMKPSSNLKYPTSESRPAFYQRRVKDLRNAKEQHRVSQ